jgi:transcriptional/translational regulatory protein YebC/TACO1
MFERISLNVGQGSPKVEDPEYEAIEAGANEVEENEDGSFSFTGALEDLDSIRTVLTSRGWEIKVAELAFGQGVSDHGGGYRAPHSY